MREFPLATNLYGTAARAEQAFGSRPLALVRRLVELAQEAMPPTLGTLWGAKGLAGELLRVGTSSRRSAPVLEVTSSEPRLDVLPALTTWAEDGGPFITLPQVYTEHPESGGSNLGVYRHAGLRSLDDRHALADRQGWRLPLRCGRGERRGRCRSTVTWAVRRR